MKRVAILGASGYTGRELMRLVKSHPSLALEGAFNARAENPEPPELACDDVIEKLDWERVAHCDGVFLCTPHATSAELAQRALEIGVKVVDLSADFRLKDAALYERTYKHVHPAPELLAEAAYGLVEHARDSIDTSRLVASPGCYPTAVLMALKPLLQNELVDRESPIVADCKSGVSGAGKTPSNRTHFGATHENFLAYGVGAHRHTPEIHAHARTTRIVFVPHLLPVFRGILATIYVPPADGITAQSMLDALRETYAGEKFVKVFASGLPELNRVQMTNQCHIGVAACGPLVVVVSAIDNLLKGASGQALQSMNRMLGLEEGAGLS
jgi:N-acetyl-gamma-glutamyl-phosphate reductase